MSVWKSLLRDARCYLAEVLIGWAVRVMPSPSNDNELQLLKAIHVYFTTMTAALFQEKKL